MISAIKRVVSTNIGTCPQKQKSRLVWTRRLFSRFRQLRIRYLPWRSCQRYRLSTTPSPSGIPLRQLPFLNPFFSVSKKRAMTL